MLDSVTDPITEIHRQLDFLKHLKRIGEEDYEIESDVMKAHKLIAAQFKSWLDEHDKSFPKDIAEFVCEMFVRFIFLRPERRTSCPLRCGKRLQSTFLAEFTEVFELSDLQRDIAKDAFKRFLKFRETLKPILH